MFDLDQSSVIPSSSSLIGPDSEKFFKLLAKTQGRRLDDQRVSLPSLPGIQGTSRSANTKVGYRSDSTNHIIDLPSYNHGHMAITSYIV